MHTSRQTGPRAYCVRFLTRERVLVSVIGAEKVCDAERTRLYRERYLRCDDGIYRLESMLGATPRHETVLRQSEKLVRRIDVKRGLVQVEAY